MATTKQRTTKEHAGKEHTGSIDESTLEMITSIQERIVDAHKEFAGAIAKVVPDVSFLPTTDRFDTPDTKSLVEQGFDFQSKLLEANRAFSLGLIEAWADVMPKQSDKK